MRIGHDIPIGHKVFCKDGKCSNCGECCSNILPLTQKEIKQIKKYIYAHNIKPCEHTVNVLRQKPVDMVCPFRDNVNKCCTIYPVRPLVCRLYMCSNGIEEFKQQCKDNQKAVSKTYPYDVWGLFFNRQQCSQELMDAFNISAMITLEQMVRESKC